MKVKKQTIDSLSLEVEEQKLIIEELRNDIKAMNEYHSQRIAHILDTVDGVKEVELPENVQPF